jgi:hypothetical protein
MAYKEDIRKRVKQQNPLALEILDMVDRKVRELGGSTSANVTLTGDMTHEERLMAVIEGCLKDGLSMEESEKKAVEVLARLDSL